MHLTKILSLLLCSAFLASGTVLAQTDDDDDDDDSARHNHHEMMMGSMNGSTPVRCWYLGGSFDGAIFSTSVMERPGHDRELTTIRFSMLNTGVHFNYDYDEHFGLFTGLGIKNIGFIEKNGDSTTKRRVYTIGVPLGFKLGNLKKSRYGFIGGGVDFPINYREKRFVERKDKYKFNEFFSDRTQNVMPYMFAGFSPGSGLVLKAQYYPGNFFDTNFEEDNNGDRVRPYQGYRVNMLYITLGLDLHYKTYEKKTNDAVAPEEM
jgi:hypothetical protein